MWPDRGYEADSQKNLAANPHPEYPEFLEDQVVVGPDLEEEKKE